MKNYIKMFGFFILLFIWMFWIARPLQSLLIRLDLFTPLYFQLFLYSLSFAVPTLLYIWIAVPKRGMLYLSKISNANLFYSVLLGFSVQPVGMFLSSIGSLFEKENVVTEFVLNIDLQNEFLIALITIAVIPAIIEEFLFRGIFQAHLLKDKRFWVATLLSSFLFALFHGNLQQFGYAFASGVFFCFVLRKTKTLLSTITMHFTINASQFSMLSFMLLYHPDPTQNQSIHLNQKLFLVLGTGLFSFPFLFLTFYLFHKLKEDPYGVVETETSPGND